MESTRITIDHGVTLAEMRRQMQEEMQRQWEEIRRKGRELKN